MKYTFSNIKKGWLISAVNSECVKCRGRVYIKKGGKCILIDNKNETYIFTKNDKFKVLDIAPVFEVEADLQTYTQIKAQLYNITILHLPKDTSGKITMGGAGWVDCICFSDNARVIFLELKTKTKLSKKQIDFKNWALSMGFEHEIAKTPAEVDKILIKYIGKIPCYKK